MWFSVDSCGSITLHDTAAQAKEAAENDLEFERDCASEGWSEEVTDIMWGKVYGKVEQTFLRPRTDEDVGVSEEFDFVADYHLEDIGRDEVADAG